MIADYNTLVTSFRECNKKYFNGELKEPKFDILHSTKTCGEFRYYNDGNKLNPRQCLLRVTDYYDFDNKQFIDILVHEMLHYYLVKTGKDMKCSHGKDFTEISKKLNEEYGLNITKKIDTSSTPKSGNAPKRSRFTKLLFG